MTLFWFGLVAVIAVSIAAYVRNQRSAKPSDRGYSGDSGSGAVAWSTDWDHRSGDSSRDNDWGGSDSDSGGGGGGGDGGGGG